MSDDMGAREPIPPPDAADDGSEPGEGVPGPGLDDWDQMPLGLLFTPGPCGWALRARKFGDQPGVILRVEGMSGTHITVWDPDSARKMAADIMRFADMAAKMVGPSLVVPKGLDLDGLGDLRGERRQ